MYLQPELVESLISVDISPINNEEINDIQGIIDVLRSINLDINAPISKVRQSADEQMKSSIEVSYVQLIISVELL